MPESISLKDAAAFIVDNRGKTVPTADAGFPLIATNCINNNDLFPRFENIRYVSESTKANWFRAHPEPGDIILTLKGSQNGAVCRVPDPVPFCIAQDMVAIRANTAIVEPDYLFAALRSPLIQHRMKQLNVDSVIPHFKKTDFDKLYIPLPELSVQKAIGRIFMTIEYKIELNRKMNETLETMARALFKSWFVDFDPVRKKQAGQATGLPAEIDALFPSEFEDSALGEIPKGWRVVTLGDVCSRITDGSHYSPKSVEQGYPMASVKDMEEISFNLASCRHITKDEYEKLVNADCKPLINDVVIAKDGSYLKHIFVIEEDIELVILSSIAILRPNSLIKPHFLNMSLRAPQVMERMTNFVSGAVIPRIVLKDFRAFQLLLPPIDLQQAWFRYCKPLLEQRYRNSKANGTLTAIRDTLLPRLISGELRVKDAERFVYG